MGSNRGVTTTGPGVCSAGLTSVIVIFPSYASSPGHGGMYEPQTWASLPMARETGGRFLGVQTLVRVGSYSLRTGVKPPGARQEGHK